MGLILVWEPAFMRTVFLLTAAALVGITAQPADAQQRRTERRVVVIQPDQAPQDGEVYSSREDRDITEADYRGRWNGQWTGQWVAPDGRRYEGTYEGAYEGQRDGPPVRARHDGHGDGRHGGPGPMRGVDYDDAAMADRCRSQGGAIGAVAGGLAGGLLGRTVAGRGNRTVGAAVGAVAGAAAGAAIERSSERRRCEDWYNDYQRRNSGGYAHGGYAEGGYEYGGGQTIIIPGAPVIVEETVTEYEDVVVAQPARRRVSTRRPVRRAAVRRPRARCHCH